MAFFVSPGVNVSEIDLTTVIPAVSTTEGAIAGLFAWGPALERILVESGDELVQRFGKPSNLNAETFFTADSFLAYGNKLFVVRGIPADTFSAFANTGAATANATNTIKNQDDYDSRLTFDSNILYFAKYPGEIGTSLKVSVCDSANAYTQNVFTAAAVNTSAISANVSIGANAITWQTSNTADATAFANVFNVGDIVRLGNSSVGYNELKVSNVAVFGANVTTNFSNFVTLNFTTAISTSANVTVTRNWEFAGVVDRAPGTSTFVQQRGGTGDELHVVVVDEDGKFTGVRNNILEVFQAVSRATDATKEDGATNYYKNVINQQSRYLWLANDRTGAISNTAANMVASTNQKPLSLSLIGGTDGASTEANVSLNVLMSAYDLFKNAEEVDVSLLLQGKARGGTHGEQLANYLVDNIAEVRKDCLVMASPDRADVVVNVGEITTDIINFRNALRNSSYLVIDSGYKYMYDKYADIYRYVPLNGDTAGLIVRTDTVRDPWWSPAGFNRGMIKNVIKLSYNPSKADRDILYKSDVNPVVTFPGQGTLLYGDKTALGKPSAFDRINVRRLFIVLEKAIATAAKFTLFEFNDEFTRASFKNMVEPFLRDVQGRRGIYDFRVVCDETNNTPEVIDRNEFVGDIYIKPARSINFIQLNFVAVRSGVEFSEIVGSF